MCGVLKCSNYKFYKQKKKRVALSCTSSRENEMFYMFFIPEYSVSYLFKKHSS